jgi:hypothetical protein
MDALWWMTAILGTIYHHQQWFWVFAFLTWFLFIGWGALLLFKIAAGVVGVPFKSENRSVPAHVATLSDLSLACLMVFTGHFIYAGLVAAQMLFEQLFFAKDEVEPSGD